METPTSQSSLKPKPIRRGNGIDVGASTSDGTNNTNYNSTPLSSPPSRSTSPKSFDQSRINGNGIVSDGSNRQPASYATMPLPSSHSSRQSRRANDKYPSISSGRNKIFGLDANALKNLAGKSEEPFSDDGVPHLTVEETACHDPSLIFAEPKSRNTLSDAATTNSNKSASLRSGKKKKKMAINTASTAADVFAATISDAMVGAENSEGDEGFVRYPKRPTSSMSHGQNQPQEAIYPDYITSPPASMRQSKSQSSYLPPRDFNDTFRSPKPSRKVSTGEEMYSNLPTHKPTRSSTYGSTAPPPSISHGYPFSPGFANDYGDFDEERQPLFDKKYPKSFMADHNGFRRLFTCFIVGVGSVMFAALLIAIFALSSRTLTDVEITQITSILAARRELIFDMHVRGRNWNVFKVTIREGDLAIFAQARSSNKNDDKRNSTLDGLAISDPAEFLGSVYHLDEPLRYTATSIPTVNTGRLSTASTQLRLRNLASGAENEHWAKIILRPYELTVRGVLKYSLTPWWWETYSTRVCGVVWVDPKTGGVTQAPDGGSVCGDGDDGGDGDDRGGPVDRI